MTFCDRHECYTLRVTGTKPVSVSVWNPDRNGSHSLRFLSLLSRARARARTLARALSLFLTLPLSLSRLLACSRCPFDRSGFRLLRCCLPVRLFVGRRLSQPHLAQRNMGWLRSVGSIKYKVSFAEYCLFYRAILQKRPKF